MVLKLEQILGSKNALAVLRHLTLRPYARYGLTELADTLHISKSNILRVLVPLVKEHLVLAEQSGRKKVLKINSEQESIRLFWKLCMEEKKSRIPANFKNVIELFYSKIKDNVDVFILFGSVATGLATEESDIDIMIIGNSKLSGPQLEYLPYRFEVHHYSWKELQEKNDFVVLEALTHGIMYKGELFKFLAELKLFPKSYLLNRLAKAKEFIKKSNTLKGPAREYYQQLAAIALGEIESILKKKKIQPKKRLQKEIKPALISELEQALAKEGDHVWIA